MLDFSFFHFAEPVWTWLLLVPCLWYVWVMFLVRHHRKPYEKKEDTGFADAHLLPYLRIADGGGGQKRARPMLWKKLLPLLLAWGLITLAMMEPRWEKQQQPLLEPDSNLMVVLDLSRSMLARDLVPDRMERTRQELSALFDSAESKGVKVGIIGYAMQANLISPLTRDMKTLRLLLPSLGPELIQLQGSNPEEAIDLARKQLLHQSVTQGVQNLHMLLVTDGDMNEMSGDVLEMITAMAQQDKASAAQPPIHLHVLAMGTAEGAPVPDDEGHYLTDKRGKAHLSRLDVAAMKRWAEAGKGRYLQADALQTVAPGLIASISKAGEAAASGWHESWKEGFFVFLILAMALLLWRMP